MYFEKVEPVGVNASPYVNEGRSLDILDHLRSKDSILSADDLKAAAAEEIMLLRDRLKGLRQKLTDLGYGFGVMDYAKYPNIWCDTCGEVKPMLAAEMKADELNNHDAVDLLCKDCKTIAATLHSDNSA